MILDIVAIQTLYGANDDAAGEENVYMFDPAVPFSKTIWDPGLGTTDEFDFSSYAVDLQIDLRSGSSSTIPTETWNMDDNLWIAYDSFIENVRSGSGSDTITGNDHANVIDGGDGSDVVYGLDGADTFVTVQGGGPDTIKDFVVGEDKLVILDEFNSALSFDDLSAEVATDHLHILSDAELVFILEGHKDTVFVSDFIDETFVIA
jgi:hypothetical protein